MNFSNYKREETPVLAEGDYRVEIIEAEETESKTSGAPMIKFTIRPNGSNIKINNYLAQNQYFNRNATKIFDSFNIEEGDFNVLTWKGAVGAAHIATDDNGYLKVKYFIAKDKADKLPAWDGEMPQRQTVTSIDGYTKDDLTDELPF